MSIKDPAYPSAMSLDKQQPYFLSLDSLFFIPSLSSPCSSVFVHVGPCFALTIQGATLPQDGFSTSPWNGGSGDNADIKAELGPQLSKEAQSCCRKT
jgi:hypothetical protein